MEVSGRFLKIGHYAEYEKDYKSSRHDVPKHNNNPLSF